MAAPETLGTSGNPSATLTWEACVKESLANNPELAQSKFRLVAAQARRNAAFGGFLPRLSAGLSAGDSGGTPYFDAVKFEDWSARLSASQSLFSGFSTVADVWRSMASVRRTKAQLRQDEANLRQSLRGAFNEVLYGQENVRVQETIASRRAANADMVRLFYEAGKENKGSLLRADADAASAALAVSRAKRALILARQKLCRELGRDEFSEVAVTGEWTVAAPPEPPDLAVAAEEVPSVIQARCARDSARADLLSAGSPWWPSLDLSAGISRHGEKWPFDEDPRWSAGASVSYSIFNGFRDSFNFRASMAANSEAASSLVAARRDARITLQQALFFYIDSFEEVAVEEKYLMASRQRAEIGRAQYANGMLGFVQWDLIENDLVNAERSYVTSRRDAMNAEAGWLRALGEGFGQ
jgi:outer membrane protein TolC